MNFMHRKKITLVTVGVLVFVPFMLARISARSHRPTPAATSKPAVILTPQPEVVLPIIMYHYVRMPPDVNIDKIGHNLSVAPKDFDQQMAWLSISRISTITPDDLVADWKGAQSLPNNSVWLTFDDGYADFYTEVFPILKKYHLKATAYVVTGFVDRPEYLTWDQIRELDQSGLVTIAAHTLSHADLTKSKRAKEEIVDSKHILEEHLHHDVTAFAYPSGRLNDAVVALVKEAGFTTAVTTKPGTHQLATDPLRLPRERMSADTSLASFKRLLNPSTKS